MIDLQLTATKLWLDLSNRQGIHPRLQKITKFNASTEYLIKSLKNKMIHTKIKHLIISIQIIKNLKNMKNHNKHKKLKIMKKR